MRIVSLSVITKFNDFSGSVAVTYVNSDSKSETVEDWHIVTIKHLLEVGID